MDWQHSEIGFGADVYQNLSLNSNEDMWSSPNNPSTGNKIDDDNNGLIDDWKGWNYAYNNNDTRTTNWHGTFVSGIIGAKRNNSLGIAGIATNNNATGGVKILPYCVGVNAPISSVIDDAIIEAVDNGVKVIQLSLSVPFSSAIEQAINYAVQHNVLVVCAAGNNSSSTISYPASNNKVIAVGAVDNNNKRAGFSNYGNLLDIVAPGVNIYSTINGNNYSTANGTSFAAPQVSAVAAILFGINPNLTEAQVRNIIESTAQKVGGYNYQTTTGRPNGTWNNEMGYGLLDAFNAIFQLLPCPITNISNQTVNNNQTITGCVINTQNVTVQNNAKLTLDATLQTVITGPFVIQQGARLEVK